MDARFLRGLSLAVVGMLAMALLAGMVLPVYTDEIGWRFQERAGFDGVDKMFSELCGANTLAVPPWFMWPVRWYSAFFNGAFADPFWVRVSGVGYALLWIGLTFALIRRLTRDRADRAVAALVGLGLLALGTMPLLLVWSRPEQPILLTAVAALLLAFADGGAAPRPQSTARQAWTRSLAIAVLGCIAIAYHLKGLFLLPLMLACLWFASRGPKAHVPRLAGGGLSLAIVPPSMAYWQGRLACPDNAAIARAYGDTSISGLIGQVSSFDQLRIVLGKMVDNIGLFQYMSSIGPKVDPPSFWLASGQIGAEASFHWFLALCVVWTVGLVVAGLSSGIAIGQAWRERCLAPRPVLAVLTFAVAAAWSATLRFPNVYEAKMVLPLLALAAVLALAGPVPQQLKAIVRGAAVAIGLAALVSPLAIAAIYAPSLARAAGQSGYIAAQPYSVSAFGFARLKPEIAGAGRLCGIGDPARARALMVDDLTYFAFMRSRLPQHELGVVRGWSAHLEDPVGYLRSRGSQGAVVGCHLLPPDLRRRAKSVGAFCCLGPPGW